MKSRSSWYFFLPAGYRKLNVWGSIVFWWSETLGKRLLYYSWFVAKIFLEYWLIDSGNKHILLLQGSRTEVNSEKNRDNIFVFPKTLPTDF